VDPGPADTGNRTVAWLSGIAASLPEKPRALRVVSARWEEWVPTVTSSVPLMVMAGAAGDDRWKVVFRDEAIGVAVSAVQFA
jgi:hypothetical protein